MSTFASINIALKQPASSIKIIQILLNYGWTFNDEGKVSYLPIGDDDNFDWQHEKIAVESLMKILEKKEQGKEALGVIMTWGETSIGGAFLFWQNGKILISLIINRKTFLSESMFEITDVNWYLSKLLPAFNQDNFFIESFSYEES